MRPKIPGCTATKLRSHRYFSGGVKCLRVVAKSGIDRQQSWNILVLR